MWRAQQGGGQWGWRRANKGENGKGQVGRAGSAIGVGLGGLGEYSKLEEGPVGVGSKRVT